MWNWVCLPPPPPQGPSYVNLCLSPISNSAKLPLVPPLRAPDLACGAAGTSFRGCFSPPSPSISNVFVWQSPSCFSSQVKLTTFLPCRLLQHCPWNLLSEPRPSSGTAWALRALPCPREMAFCGSIIRRDWLRFLFRHATILQTNPPLRVSCSSVALSWPPLLPPSTASPARYGLDGAIRFFLSFFFFLMC